MKSIAGKKIELLPHELKENQIPCSFCGGIGWLQDDDEKHISQCHHCYNGVVDVCPHCRKPYEFKYSHTCKNQECMKIEQEERDKKAFEGQQALINIAEKLDPKGAFDRFYMLYSDYVNSDEGYFDDWDTFFDAWYEHEQEEKDCFNVIPVRPEYVWGTQCIHLSMDADTIIEQATDDLWEGARDNISDKDYKELQDLLDNWCKKQSGNSTYGVDYKYAVKIPWELYES